MIRALRRLVRRFRKPIAIPGKYPWSIKTDDPTPYGTLLFEDDNSRHYADGCGGIVSQLKPLAERLDTVKHRSNSRLRLLDEIMERNGHTRASPGKKG